MGKSLPVLDFEMTPECEKVLADWYSAATELKALGTREGELRAQLYSFFYAEDDVKRSEAGTEKFKMPGGWVMAIERRINVSIDQAQLNSIEAEVQKLAIDEDTGEMPTIGPAIKMKPSFSESGYRDLRDDVKALLNAALEFTPGTPGLKLEPPKAKATARASDQKANAS